MESVENRVNGFNTELSALNSRLLEIPDSLLRAPEYMDRVQAVEDLVNDRILIHLERIEDQLRDMNGRLVILERQKRHSSVARVAGLILPYPATSTLLD